jgi:hypothetical protein
VVWHAFQQPNDRAAFSCLPIDGAGLTEAFPSVKEEVMSCDIHFHSEVKINGRWEHYSTPSVRHCYPFFALLCGVRLDEEDPTPISGPRGLPGDISAVTRFEADLDVEDGHSHSWICAKELVEVDDRWSAWHSKKYPGKSAWETHLDIEHHLIGYLFGNSWAAFTKYPEERPAGIEDVRWVFWFDN